MNNVNLKITATFGGGPLIRNGLALYAPFDSILAYFLIEEKKARIGSPLAPEEIQEIIDQELPLEKIVLGTSPDYINAASMVFLEGEHTQPPETIYKAIKPQQLLDAGIDLESVVDGVTKRYFGAHSGSYKTGAPTLYPRLAETATWTVRGDATRITELLKNWTNYGKKISIGYGRILKHEIAEVDNPMIIRPLPCDYYAVTPLTHMRTNPAYWNTGRQYLCGIGDLTSARRPA